MKRRTFCSLLSVSLFAGAGCLDNQSPQARVAYVWLVNDRDEEYDVDVVIAENEEVVFSQTCHLGTGSNTAVTTEDNPVEGYGRYIVRATMDGETREVDTADAVDGDEDCVGIRFSLLNNGSVNYWTKSMQQC